MNDANMPHFVGLDIGTSQVRCVVGIVDDKEGRTSIVGHGSAVNHGMRKGVVSDVTDTADAVVQAIAEAERVSGLHIDRATVNINGTHVGGIDSKGVIAISAANREIAPEDVARVEDAATVLQLPANREIIQLFTKSYSLDGQANIKDPVGMRGVRLEVDTHLATVASPNLRNLDTALERARLLPNRHTLGSLASAETTLTRQHREAGTVLLDIGASTINLVVMEDGEVQHVAVLPMGGMYITNDLAIGLRVDLDLAEKVKLQHASLNSSKKGSVSVEYNGEKPSFKTSDIQMITSSRVEHMLEYIDKELQKIHRSKKLPGGVVLTGGTAKLPGIADFVRDKLQLPARVGRLQPLTGLIETVDDPSYYSAVGLMMLDAVLPHEQPSNHSYNLSNTTRGLVDKIIGYFGKH